MPSMLRLAQATTTALRLADVVEAAAGAAAALVEDGFVLVWVLAEDRLVLRGAAGTLGATHGGLRPEFSPGEGLVGHTALAGAVTIVPEPSTDPRARYAEFLAAEGVRTFVGVPLAARYGLEGVLGVFTRTPGEPTGATLEALGVLAAQAALALQSARLFGASERRRRAAEALAAVGQALAHALDPRAVAHLIADSVIGLLGARDVVVYRLDAAGDLVSVAFAGEGAARFTEPMVLPRGAGAAGRAVLDRKPVITHDFLNDPRLHHPPALRAGYERAGYRYVMAVPLLVDGAPIGALGAAAGRDRVFDDESRQLLEAFADQAAVAINNTRLFAAERAARAAAEAAERRFRDLVHGVDAVLTEVDVSTRRVLFVNGRVESLLGYTVEQWMTEPDFWRRHLHPDDCERVLTLSAAETAAGRDFVHEYRMLAADGRIVWLRDSVTLNAGRLRSLKVDVTARKRGELLLAGESQVLTLIAAGEPLPRVLDALCRMLEAQDGDMLSSVVQVEDGRLRTAAAPSLPETYVRAVDGLALGAEAESAAAAFRGEPVIVDDVATDPRWAGLRHAAQAHGLRACWSMPILGAAGEPIATLATYYRTSRAPGQDELRIIARAARLAGIAIERTRAEEALRAREQQYRTLIMNIPDVAWLTDREGRTVFISPHVDRIGGYTAEEIYRAGPAAWFGRVHPDDLPILRKHFAALFEGGEMFDLEYRMQHKDGRWIWLRDRAVTTYEEHGVLYAYGIYTDVTDRKRVEEIRALLLNQVITVQEEERRRIARELHDETAQSLASLLLGLSALQESRTVKGARAQARELHQVATRALAEVRRLAWGLRPSVLDDLGLPAALERYASELARTRGIAVEIDTGGLGPGRLSAAIETALYRIMQEALSNVVRHAGARRVRLRLDRFGAMVSMVIADDGRGFDPDRPPAPATAAHGLGIHTMRERALVLNGTLTIQSAPGAGTRVSVEMPLAVERA
jgi:PAS domain S-box-containing protein